MIQILKILVFSDADNTFLTKFQNLDLQKSNLKCLGIIQSPFWIAHYVYTKLHEHSLLYIYIYIKIYMGRYCGAFSQELCSHKNLGVGRVKDWHTYYRIEWPQSNNHFNWKKEIGHYSEFKQLCHNFIFPCSIPFHWYAWSKFCFIKIILLYKWGSSHRSYLNSSKRNRYVHKLLVPYSKV